MCSPKEVGSGRLGKGVISELENPVEEEYEEVWGERAPLSDASGLSMLSGGVAIESHMERGCSIDLHYEKE